MIVFLQDFNYLLDIENESVYNIGIVNKREIIMTPAVFKNRYMRTRNIFKDMKKEPFESFETLEDSYEMPEVLDYEIKDAISNAVSKLTPREQLAIKGRFFDDLTLGQIGWSFGQLEGDYGVSEERARQILSKALRKLRHFSMGLKEVA
tara:strand:- start:9146 stop:9592 length:447 start_codon:yes stop_codon:yes gene_type:complete